MTKLPSDLQNNNRARYRSQYCTKKRENASLLTFLQDSGQKRVSGTPTLTNRCSSVMSTIADFNKLLWYDLLFSKLLKKLQFKMSMRSFACIEFVCLFKKKQGIIFQGDNSHLVCLKGQCLAAYPLRTTALGTVIQSHVSFKRLKNTLILRSPCLSHLRTSWSDLGSPLS